jgi:hypothetical protein
MNPIFKWVLVAVVVLLIGAYTALSFMAGSPKDAFYMLRFALPHMHAGKLKVGDDAPNVSLVALDGTTRFPLHDRLTGKPLVLVFGSFT